jgi:hypothetical protein
LKNDARDKTDEGEGLADAHQQFGAVVVRGGPRASQLSIENCRSSDAQESGGHEQSRIETMQEQQRRDARHKEERDCGPNDCRADLIGFEPMNGKRLRNENDRREQAESKDDQCQSANDRVPFLKKRKVHERVRLKQAADQRYGHEENAAEKQCVE